MRRTSARLRLFALGSSCIKVRTGHGAQIQVLEQSQARFNEERERHAAAMAFECFAAFDVAL
jgi:hypothetical protein